MELVAPHTAGDPMSQTKWLNCRLSDVQSELESKKHAVSTPVISRLLRAQDYELHLNVKTLEGGAHPQRDEQFQYIEAQQAQHQAAGQPQLSVDTKKKELIGDFKNPGRSWGPAAEPVNIHDFPSEALAVCRRGMAGRCAPTKYGQFSLTTRGFGGCFACFRRAETAPVFSRLSNCVRAR